MMKFKDKVVIITGSARALGKDYALYFAKEGAKIVACDIKDCADTVKQIQAIGSESLAIPVDVTSEERTAEMAKKTFERFGRIDVLINNAAIYAEIVRKPFYQISAEEWDKVMAVNMKGVFLCSKAVFPYMKEQGKGKIINVSSSVHHLGRPNLMHYVASTSGVIGITRSMAREVGQYNITVNAIAPGLFPTEYNMWQIPKERLEKDKESRSIKRDARHDDLFGLIAFLASDESDFITGQTIIIDGGESFS